MTDFKKHIANIPNFPKEGILFRDITPLMLDGKAYQEAVNKITEFAKDTKADLIIGPEARGFIFGCPVATNLGVGFAPVRKKGKLPRETIEFDYTLEYGTNTLCLHKDAIKPGQKVLIVDDLLATGGTAYAATKLVEKLGGVVCGIAFLLELTNLKGIDLIKDYKTLVLAKY